MTEEVPDNVRSFVRGHIQIADRLLIESTCRNCGQSKVASHHDGSLERWEDGHICEHSDAKAS